MKKFLLALLCTCLMSTSYAKTFSELYESTQKDLIRKLSVTLLTENVQVISLQRRTDDIFRSDPFFGVGKNDLDLKFMFNLSVYRFLNAYKGNVNLTPQDRIYIERLRNETSFILSSRASSPYKPYMSSDLSSVAFVVPKKFDKKKLKIDRCHNLNEVKGFLSDAELMKTDELLAKYKLAELFEKRAFTVVNDCFFYIHQPIVDMPVTESMRMNNHGVDEKVVQARRASAYARSIKDDLYLDEAEISELLVILDLFRADKSIDRLIPELVLHGNSFKTRLAKEFVNYFSGFEFGGDLVKPIDKKRALKLIRSESLLRAFETNPGSFYRNETGLLEAMKVFRNGNRTKYLELFGDYTSVNQIVAADQLVARLKQLLEKSTEKFKSLRLLLFQLRKLRYLEKASLVKRKKLPEGEEVKELVAALRLTDGITLDNFSTRSLRVNFQRDRHAMFSRLKAGAVVFDGKLEASFKLPDISKYTRIHLKLKHQSNKLIYYRKTIYPKERYDKELLDPSWDEKVYLLKKENKIVFNNLPLNGAYTLELNYFLRSGRVSEENVLVYDDEYFAHGEKYKDIKLPKDGRPYTIDLSKPLQKSILNY